MMILIFAIAFIPWVRAGGLCGEKGYACKSDNKCIPEEWICDDEPDCLDGDDETNCHLDCSDSVFKCLNVSQCIKGTWRCDGDKDCRDGSDEIDCEGIDHCPNDGSHFSCGVKKPCISIELICDGHWECPNGEDEDYQLCSNMSCKEYHFKCWNDPYCINKRWVCDGSQDCKDGSDEKNCDAIKCGKAEFTCINDSPKCIDLGAVCNGIEDCGDGSDEIQCNLPSDLCPDGEGICDMSKNCIPIYSFCDGKVDCLGDTDESNCSEITCSHYEFQCLQSRHCLPGWMVCDGENECEDGSDESNCDYLRVHRCGREEFNCTGTKDSMCIPGHKLCDGYADCPNSVDESNAICFNKSLCNISCKHGKCVISGERARCVCNEGFDWSTETCTCEDIDECQDGVCSQICTNKIGSFKCSCNPGYELNTLDRNICRVKDGDSLLLFVSGKEVRYMDLRNHAYESLVKFEGQVKAFDFDIWSGNIFISDYSSGSIYRVNKFLPNEPKLIWKGFEPRSVENIAFDWIFKNLYIVTHHRIDMLHVSNKSGATHLKYIAKCSSNHHYFGIVIDPRQEHNNLYWTVTGTNSSIVKSSLDGNMITTFVGNNIFSPVSLTMDFETNYLYWIDAKLYAIFKKSLNVEDNRIFSVISSYIYLRQSHSIDFFESHLFWSLNMGRIHKLHVTSLHSSFNKTAVILKDGLSHLSGVKVAHHLKQPMVEHQVCRSHKCSHICLPNPNKMDHYMCTCPDSIYGFMDDFKLGSDGFNCQNFPIHEEGPLRNPTYFVIGIIMALVLAIILVIILIKKKANRQSIKAMNFTNPVYKKNQRDDNFIVSRNQSLSASELIQELEGQTLRQANLA